MQEASALARAVGRKAPGNLAEARRLADVGERVAAAPDASPESLAADLWDTGVERAADIATAVAELEQARKQIDDGLTDAAWTMDLVEARTRLAAHGTGVFRSYRGEGRRPNRLTGERRGGRAGKGG